MEQKSSLHIPACCLWTMGGNLIWCIYNIYNITYMVYKHWLFFIYLNFVCDFIFYLIIIYFNKVPKILIVTVQWSIWNVKERLVYICTYVHPYIYLYLPSFSYWSHTNRNVRSICRNLKKSHLNLELSNWGYLLCFADGVHHTSQIYMTKISAGFQTSQ